MLFVVASVALCRQTYDDIFVHLMTESLHANVLSGWQVLCRKALSQDPRFAKKYNDGLVAKTGVKLPCPECLKNNHTRVRGSWSRQVIFVRYCFYLLSLNVAIFSDNTEILVVAGWLGV